MKIQAAFFGSFTPSSIGLEACHDFAFIPVSPSVSKSLSYLSSQYLSHKYDLLGSGWVQYSYEFKAFGLKEFRYSMNTHYDIKSLVAPSNLRRSSAIASLIEPSYRPIDWQKDIKSGFRWDTKSFYCDQYRLGLPGSDIKVPWEIGRLQHLPQLALVSHQSRHTPVFHLEFRNQVYDFISSNPPSYGVQWVCTMDVGIRIANILLAYALFKPVDKVGILSGEFDVILAQSVYEHGLHITRNLEYGENLTSNHYLSNIIGLLFVSVFLESSLETDAWLGFAVQELLSETKKQFYEDGSNFEGSTCYHRLSTELIVFGAALILGLKKEKICSLSNYSAKEWKHKPSLKPYTEQDFSIVEGKVVFPKYFSQILHLAGKFTLDISKQNGRVAQIGDNDSGRLFRLSPVGSLLKTNEAKAKYINLSAYDSEEEFYWDEDILNHQTLLSAMHGLGIITQSPPKFPVEDKIVSILANGEKIGELESVPAVKVSSSTDYDDLQEHSLNKIQFPKKGGRSLLVNCKCSAYPDSGIYVISSDRLHLVVSAGPVGQNGNGGHGHNDKISFDLYVDGEDLFLDPGTFIYTALPEERNRFRSINMHNTILVQGKEQNGWFPGKAGLFSMKANSSCHLFGLRDNFIDVGVEYRGIKARRKFTVCEDLLKIESFCSHPYKEFIQRDNYFSNGYGKIEQMNLDKGKSRFSVEKK